MTTKRAFGRLLGQTTPRAKQRAKALSFGAVGLLSMAAAADVARLNGNSQLKPPDDLYTVQGNATYDTFGRGARYTFTFSLTVSNHCWAVEVLSVEAPGLGENQVCDGVNIVAWRHYDTTKIDRSKVSKWTDGYVRIGDIGMAEDLTIVTPAIWVAYAAQFYLPSGTNNGLLRPFWHPERSVRTKAFVPARWRLLSPESALPDSIDFFYDVAGWDSVLGRGHTQNPSSDRAEKSIPLAVYRSLGKTNLAGRLFPLAWAFTGFAAEREHSSGERLPVSRIEATNITVRSGVEHRLFDTFFRGVAVVEDYRWQRSLPLLYEITNSAAPGLSDERRLAAVRQELQLQLAMKRKEVLTKDWTFRTSGRRFGLRVFQPFDGKGGHRYAVMFGRLEFSFGDDRARTKERRGVSVWIPALVLLVVVGVAIGLRRTHRRKTSQHGLERKN